MKLRFSSEAIRQVEDIARYIRTHDQAASRRVKARLQAAAELLARSPLIGRPGVATGTREWSVVGLPYRIVYELDLDRDELVVAAVYHTARGMPPSTEHEP